MCGIMLKHHGYNVTILEQEAQAFRPGYDAGMSLRGEAGDFLKAHDRVGREMTIDGPPGKDQPLPQRGLTLRNTSWGLLLRVLRANFDGLTSEAVPVAPGPREGDGVAFFKNGTRVTDVGEIGEKMQVQFESIEDSTISSLTADIVLVADGSTSALRRTLLPEVEREYLGYMCWRGTVPEELVDEKWNEIYSGKTTFEFMDQNYVIIYTIPTDDGDFRAGKCLYNWVWYSKMAEGSPEMKNMFTDVKGVEHRGTVPRSLARPEVWEKQKATGKMSEGLASIMDKTSSPFLTKCSEVYVPRTQFFGGKLFLVGDAQTTLRPNIGMSSAHAAYDCIALEQVIEGKKTPEQWEQMVLRWSALKRKYGQVIACYGLGTKMQAIWHAFGWLLLMVRQKLGMA
jgi:2-polyprenyl-6-methoxyphenol hydroxylase-like FAD-dependent oxidoreductase